LWHGANWTFVAWGAFHGVLLAFERWLGKKPLYARFPRPIRMLITFVLILFSWVLFRSNNFGEAMAYFGAMFGMGGAGGGAVLLSAQIYTPTNFLSMALCVLVVVCPVQSFDWVKRLSWPKAIALAMLFCWALVMLLTQSFNPFLYFQF
jgi:alginate O-acetyltransferase complex protein AlgI